MTHCLHPCCILAGVLEMNTARWHVKCQPDSCSRLTASCFSWQILIGKMPFQAAYLLCLVHMETKVTPSPIFQPLNKKDKQKVTTWSKPFTNIAKGDQDKKLTTPEVFEPQPGPSLLFSLPGPCLGFENRWPGDIQDAIRKIENSSLLYHIMLSIIIYFVVPVEASFWATKRYWLNDQWTN